MQRGIASNCIQLECTFFSLGLNVAVCARRIRSPIWIAPRPRLTCWRSGVSLTGHFFFLFSFFGTIRSVRVLNNVTMPPRYSHELLLLGLNNVLRRRVQARKFSDSS
jgi:hypothetical protein